MFKFKQQFITDEAGRKVAVIIPFKQFQKALVGVKRLYSVENNATGQLAKLVKGYGFNVNHMILKYDGRPFSVDELDGRLAGVIR